MQICCRRSARTLLEFDGRVVVACVTAMNRSSLSQIALIRDGYAVVEKRAIAPSSRREEGEVAHRMTRRERLCPNQPPIPVLDDQQRKFEHVSRGRERERERERGGEGGGGNGGRKKERKKKQKKRKRREVKGVLRR